MAALAHLAYARELCRKASLVRGRAQEALWSPLTRWDPFLK